MLSRLPLGFLPAFEAAGRLGSFTAAARELHVTVSAVSQQIKALEEALGSALFERHGRTVALTSHGRAYLSDVQRALDQLARAGERLARPAERTVLRLSTAPLVAHHFLLPRLGEFRRYFPQLELQVEASMRLVDLNVGCDAALRVGGGPWPGLVTRALGVAYATPVCAPTLAPHIRRPEDLAAQTLIDVRGQEQRGFEALLRPYGLEIDRRAHLTFESCLEGLRAAEHGLGVALGIFPFASEWVLDGRLAVPLEERVQLPGQVSLVHRRDEESFPFRELALWLEAEFQKLPALPSGRIVHGRVEPLSLVRGRAGNG